VGARLSHIFARLDMGSRVELARAFVERSTIDL